MRLLCGTSGFSYPAWKGTFYPEDLPNARMLAHYAGQLPTVEINNTFYRMPVPKLLSGWAAEVPESFRFALKAARRITHEKRLAEADQPLAHFLDTARTLGVRLGPILFQLPPFLRRDLPRLEAFLALLPADVPAAFEFRHDSWFEDAVFAALAARGAALCIADSDDLETPLRATAGFGYLRLRREAYDEAALAAWAGRISAQPWQEAYAFFKHEDAGVGPRLAAGLSAAFAGGS